MFGEAKDKTCATFTWILENASYSWHKNGELIRSPAFAVDSVWNTKWRLVLYFRGGKNGSDLGVCLQREPDCNGPLTVDVGTELAILTADGSSMKLATATKSSFQRGTIHGDRHCVKREEVFISKRSLFLPDDTMTIRCRMWKDGNLKISKVILARTRIAVERRSFLWEIEKFSSLQPHEKMTHPIHSASKDETNMSLNLSLTGGLSCEEKIKLELITRDKRIKFSTLKVFLLDASGNALECFQCEFLFDNTFMPSEDMSLTKKLIAKRDQFLPNDVLSLQCECVFTTGILFAVIEKVSFERAVDSSNMLRTKHPTASRLDSVEKLSVSSSTLKDNLKSLFTDRILCDTELRTSTGTFPAHMNILSARSPVFKAMFSNDMKEKAKKCVDIEDLKDDTVRSMLLYVYTAVVDDLQLDSASKLYVAADKYQILTLKMKCSEFIKSHMCSANACELLILADLHQDYDLKSHVQNFILRNQENVMNSDKWKYLMESHLKLAADTMYLKFKK